MFKPGSRPAPRSSLSRLKRRPSASMVVATLALFVALSGGAYAAVSIPNNSVGFAQLRSGAVGFRDIAKGAVGTRDLANNAVSYAKIAPGEIGHARVAQNQIQWRINGTCSGAQGVQSVSDTGNVSCVNTLPTDYSTAGLSEPLTSPTSATVLATESIPAGDATYVTSSPYIQVSGGGGTQTVTVSCEIAVGTQTQTRDATFQLGVNHESAAGEIPLSVSAPSTPSASAVTVACSRGYNTGSAPTVQASASVDAIQTAGASTTTTPGASTTAYSITVPTTQTTATTTTTASTPTS